MKSRTTTTPLPRRLATVAAGVLPLLHMHAQARDQKITRMRAREAGIRFGELPPGPGDDINPLFKAVLEATEEANVNPLFAATDVSSRFGTARAIPADEVRKWLARHDEAGENQAPARSQ